MHKGSAKFNDLCGEMSIIFKFPFPIAVENPYKTLHKTILKKLRLKTLAKWFHKLGPFFRQPKAELRRMPIYRCVVGGKASRDAGQTPADFG